MAPSSPRLPLLLLLTCAPLLALATDARYGYGSTTWGCYEAQTNQGQCNTIVRAPPPGFPVNTQDQPIDIGDASAFCEWAGALNETRGVSSVYPDPVNCAGFYACLYNEADPSVKSETFTRCADGLLYDMDVDQCLWSSDFTCPPIVTDDGSSSDPPSDLQTSTGVTCRGYAYDGYLSRCTIWFDNDGDKRRTSADLNATIIDGQFSIGGDIGPQLLGIARIDPAPGTATTQVTPAMLTDGTDVPCYDMATMMPLRVSLAAPWPTTCQSPIVVSPLTTVMAYGVSLSDLITALNLDSVFATGIGKVDMMKAAARGDPQARKVVAAEMQLMTLATLNAELLAADPRAYASLAAVAFRSVVQQVNNSPSGRRLQGTTAGSLDLTNPDTVTELLQKALTEAQLSIPSQYYTAVPVAVLTAVSKTVSALSTSIASATNVADIQKAMVVISTTLASKVQALASSGDVATFESETSADKIAMYLQAATIPGAIDVVPDDEQTKKSKTGAIVGGVVGGVGGALLVAAVSFFVWKHVQAKKKLASPPAGAMYEGAGAYSPPVVNEAQATADPWR